MSECLLGYRLCGVPGCEICAGIVLEVSTPQIYVGEYNLRCVVLRWSNYPIVDSSDYEHFLSPEATRDYIKHNNMTFEQLKKGLPNPNDDNKEKKSISKAREIDKAFNFENNKGREFFSCDNCDAHRCIYSNKKLVRREGQPQLK